MRLMRNTTSYLGTVILVLLITMLRLNGQPEQPQSNKFFARQTNTTISTQQGKLLYSSALRGENAEIDSIYEDGTGQLKLAFVGTTRSFSPSPDNRKIAFTSDQDVRYHRQIYVMNADGSQQTQLTTASVRLLDLFLGRISAACWTSDRCNLADRRCSAGNDNYAPAWSPDSKQIIFSCQPHSGDDSQICMINSDGSNLTKLTRDAGNKSYTRWSPDGKYIVFVVHLGENHHEIDLIDLKNNAQRRIIDIGYIEDFLSWSPDTRHIIFASNGKNFGKQYQIYSIDISGMNLSQLTDNGSNHFPAWSTDGKYIIFASYHEDSYQIYIMNPDGSGQVKLTDLGSNWSPTWSSDSRHVAFVSNRDGHSEIYVMNVDGTNQTRVTYSDDKDSDNPIWMF
jgi:Tol biopolymer transport system component